MKKLLFSALSLVLCLSACANADVPTDTDFVTHGADADTHGVDVGTPPVTSALETEITEPEAVIIDAPFIWQTESYPNGCESVTAVMALRYLGFDIGVDEFIDGYLPCGPRPVVGGIGPDPSQVYCGDPRSQYGWGCYSSVIANALNEVTPPETNVLISHFYGKPLDELCRDYIDSGIPVIVWATVGMVDSSSDKYTRVWHTEDGKKIEYNSRLHCLLLVGYDENNYYFNDPMHLSETDKCYIAYDKAAVQTAYEILGMQSIAVSLSE